MILFKNLTFVGGQFLVFRLGPFYSSTELIFVARQVDNNCLNETGWKVQNRWYKTIFLN